MFIALLLFLPASGTSEVNEFSSPKFRSDAIHRVGKSVRLRTKHFNFNVTTRTAPAESTSGGTPQGLGIAVVGRSLGGGLRTNSPPARDARSAEKTEPPKNNHPER